MDPPKKELHFFDVKYIDRHRNWATSSIKRVVGNLIKREVRKDNPDYRYVSYLSHVIDKEMFSESWYEHCFSWVEELSQTPKSIGEITPAYSMIPVQGVEYLKNYLNDPTVIYIVRNPVERALSHVRMIIERRNIDESKLTEKEWKEIVDEPLIYQCGDYKEYIENWEKVFGKGVINIFPFGEIKKSPDLVLEKIEKLLGVSPYTYKNAVDPIHKTRKIEIPEYARSFLKEKMKAQEVYLVNKFGEGFYKEC